MDTAALPVIALGGSPRERGRAHGELLRGRIAELLALWGNSLETIHGIGRVAYVERFMAETAYEATTRKLAARVIEEVEGIAEGSAQPFADILAFQHVNEEFALAPRFARGAAPQGEACSTVIVAPEEGRPTLIAQNLDLAQFLDGFQTLFRYPCDTTDGEILALSVPGMISLNGMNSHGFAICDNALVQLRPDPSGLPIYALYRLLLESRSLAEGEALVRSIPHAAGLNWVMGDPEGAAMIERSGSLASPHPAVSGTPSWHTNHPLHLGDWSPDSRTRASRSSYLRLAALHQRLHGIARPDIEILKAALASQDDPAYPVSRGGGRNLEDQEIGFTLAASVFELQRGEPRWHLAAGPSHRTAFRVFEF
jgi:hypothetical protein